MNRRGFFGRLFGGAMAAVGFASPKPKSGNCELSKFVDGTMKELGLLEDALGAPAFSIEWHDLKTIQFSDKLMETLASEKATV